MYYADNLSIPLAAAKGAGVNYLTLPTGATGVDLWTTLFGDDSRVVPGNSSYPSIVVPITITSPAGVVKATGTANYWNFGSEAQKVYLNSLSEDNITPVALDAGDLVTCRLQSKDYMAVGGFDHQDFTNLTNVIASVVNIARSASKVRLMHYTYDHPAFQISMPYNYENYAKPEYTLFIERTNDAASPTISITSDGGSSIKWGRDGAPAWNSGKYGMIVKLYRMTGVSHRWLGQWDEYELL